MAGIILNQPDDYLMAIWQLAAPVGERPAGRRLPTAPARIAELLGVSRPTVGTMLGKLEERGLVERGERREALLTPAGRAEAMRTVRKHRVVATFLVERLGYALWEVRPRAAGLVDGFDDESIERLYEFLGSPERSPHGFPVDPDHELRENVALTLAHRATAGTDAVVVRISEQRPDVQQALVERRIAPGAKVTVAAVAAATATLRVGRASHELERSVAAAVYLRPAGVPAVPARATCWADILRRERELAAGRG
jgi:DtxR family transcriptional regulator, Mn-dependent transcriptional regulator